jgi:hypothetical protein
LLILQQMNKSLVDEDSDDPREDAFDEVSTSWIGDLPGNAEFMRVRASCNIAAESR